MKEQKRKGKKEIVVLDKGIDTETIGSGMRLCCRGPFFAFR
jgi:hypothetical protein